MNRKPSTAKKADSTAAKRKTARKPKAKTKAARKKVVLATAEGIEPETVSEPVGRPTDYRPEYIDDAREMAEAGFTDQQMMDFFGCSKPTFYRWQKRFPEFRNAIKVAKEGPDDEMERSLFHRGKGYEWTEQQAFKLKEVSWEDGNKVERERVEVVDVRRVVPPDSTAAIFWLKNRRGWKDKSEVDHGITDALAALLGQIDGDGASIV
jgi:hypothetical protein